MGHQREIRTTCPYCGVGCGINIAVSNNAVAMRGDPRHPANFGRLCSKGSALGETLGLEGRLLYPEIGGRRVSWAIALDTVAEKLGKVIAHYGPAAVAFYVSGQLLTEDYYVANKLIKGFIGSANIDTNSRLCMSSSVAGHRRAFGADIVPGHYQDLEQAELIVLVGSNLAWCHAVIHQRILAAQKTNPRLRIVVVDPRRTATCEGADLHLALRPGSDTVLFNGLLHYLHRRGCIDQAFIKNNTEGYWAALRVAGQVAADITTVAHRCGLDNDQVERFYRLFADTEKTVTVYSQGVNQSSCGTDNVNAIINCHLASGRIGKAGTGPFSMTGQPNAMGGREVGGMADQLAAHMGFTPENIARVGRFWQARRMAQRPGLKAVDMFQAVADGRIKAIWIMATNPVVSLPAADLVKAAIERCEWVVVSDAWHDTDTLACAPIRLPALTWGEKEGTVTNSERRISRQRAFLPPSGEARADWWIVSQIAQRLGYPQAFSYSHPAQIFREHAALSGFENNGTRGFDISALAEISDDQYEHLEPLQWPLPAGAGIGTARPFADGRFYTQSQRARLIPIGERAPGNRVDAAYPLVLNTGRVRDHWHTMTRTGRSARLSCHVPEPYAELHPQDAQSYGIAEGSLLWVTSRWGEVIVRARLSEDQQRGSVFVPMHWSGQFAGRGRIDAVVNPIVDPLSGQPESKHTPVCIRPYRPAWYGFVLSRTPLPLIARQAIDYWVMVRGRECWRYEIAGDGRPDDWRQWAQNLCSTTQEALEWIDYRDISAGRYRAAAIANGRLERCVFIAPDHTLPPRSWLIELFTAKERLRPDQRQGILAARPRNGRTDGGRIVCSCFGVGLNTLAEAIRGQGLSTPEAIGAALQAGTHCGSCLSELRALISRLSARSVA